MDMLWRLCEKSDWFVQAEEDLAYLGPVSFAEDPSLLR